MAGYKASQPRGANGRWTVTGSIEGSTKITRGQRIKQAAVKGYNKGYALHQAKLQPKIDAYYKTPIGRLHWQYSKDRFTRFAPPGSKLDLAARIAAVPSAFAAVAGLTAINPIAGAVAAKVLAPGIIAGAWNLADWGREAYKRKMNPPPPPPPLRIASRLKAAKRAVAKKVFKTRRVVT